MKSLTLLLTVFWWVGALWAQPIGAASSRFTHESGAMEAVEESEHQPRHGGQFGDADDLYHYEVLLDAPRQLRLYVNDEHNRPLNVRLLQGRWTLDPDGPSPRTGTLAPSIDGGYFVASLPALTTDSVHVEVAVFKDTVWAEMEFYLPLLYQ